MGTVGTCPASLSVLRDTHLIGLIGHWAARWPPPGLVAFEVPLELPALTARFSWHPRHDADPAHAWLARLRT